VRGKGNEKIIIVMRERRNYKTTIVSVVILSKGKEN